MVLTTEILQTNVAIATLGSISILTANFIEKLDFVQAIKRQWYDPYIPYLVSGLLLLLVSSFRILNGAYNLFESIPILIDASDIALGVALGFFFIASLSSLINYFKYKPEPQDDFNHQDQYNQF